VWAVSAVSGQNIVSEPAGRKGTRSLSSGAVLDRSLPPFFHLAIALNKYLYCGSRQRSGAPTLREKERRKGFIL